MANNYTLSARNTMVAALPATLFIALHTQDPGQTGNFEVAGTTRQPVSLEIASNGERSVSESFVDIEVASGDVISYIGVFTAATGGTFIASVDVQEATFNQDSVYRVSDISFDLNLTVA